MNTLDFIARQVGSLKPGESIQISRLLMRDVESGLCSFGYNGARWTQAEAVLENVVGSNYSIDHHEDIATGNYIFHRLKEPSKTPLRISPDRR